MTTHYDFSKTRRNTIATRLKKRQERREDVVGEKPGRHTSLDIHRALFRKGAPKRQKLDELKAVIRRHIRKRHARSGRQPT